MKWAGALLLELVDWPFCKWGTCILNQFPILADLYEWLITPREK